MRVFRVFTTKPPLRPIKAKTNLWDLLISTTGRTPPPTPKPTHTPRGFPNIAWLCLTNYSALINYENAFILIVVCVCGFEGIYLYLFLVACVLALDRVGTVSVCVCYGHSSGVCPISIPEPLACLLMYITWHPMATWPKQLPSAVGPGQAIDFALEKRLFSTKLTQLGWWESAE